MIIVVPWWNAYNRDSLTESPLRLAYGAFILFKERRANRTIGREVAHMKRDSYTPEEIVVMHDLNENFHGRQDNTEICRYAG